ncbi:MAG TPA: glycosyltransferase 87 family protein [Pseudonocardia sp.]|jgi:uncharacterized membrane protein
MRVVPTWTEPFVGQASAVVGGPLGRHAVVGRSRFWTPLRVLLLAAVLTLAAGWLVKSPCLQQAPGPDGQLTLDWQNGRQYVSMCYTDVVTLYGDHRLAGGGLPYRTHWTVLGAGAGERYMDYPVLTGFLLWVTARLTGRYEAQAAGGGLPTGLPEVVFFTLTAVVLAACWLTVVWAVRRMRPVRPWDAALVALSPLALLHVFTGVDAVAVAGSSVALYLFARGSPGRAGALLGVAACATVYAALLLVPVTLVAWRRRQLAGARAAVLGATASWWLLNLPIAVVFTSGWPEFLRGWLRGGPEPDSVYFALSTFTGWPGFDGVLAPAQTPTRLNMVVVGLFLACCVGLAVLVRRAPRPPRLASLCFLVVAAALLVNKAWSPQFSLWLVPLAVLALPRWRLLVAWMTVDALVWVPRMFYYLGVDNKGVPPEVFLTFVLVRDAMVVLLAALVVRSVLHPETDPVRALDPDDPDWPGADPDRAPRSATPERSGPAPADTVDHLAR